MGEINNKTSINGRFLNALKWEGKISG